MDFGIQSVCRMYSRTQIEEWFRTHAGGCYVGDGRVLCRVFRKHLMVVDGHDLSVAPHLIMRGCWEPWITKAIATRVEPGWRCIDVGAHMGYYTLLLADLVGDQGRVLAVEPNPANASLAWDNVKLNGFEDRVELHRNACSDGAREMKLSVPGRYTGGASLRADAAGDVVHVSRLDTMVESPEWDFIKIDVEGHEREVLRGMKQIIEASEHLAIAVEVTPHDWLPDSPEGFFNALTLQGFSVGVIADSGSIEPLKSYADLPAAPGQWSMLWLEK